MTDVRYLVNKVKYLMELRFRTDTSRTPALLFAAFALAQLTAQARAQAPESKPSSGLLNRGALAANASTHKVYAVDTAHAAVEIYDDLSQSSHRVHVGSEPVSVAVNTATGKAYVANAGDGTVSVLDAASDQVVATIPVGSHPYSIAANSATGKVYVTHTFGDQLTIIDGANNIATDSKTGSADLIAIDAKRNIIHLLGYGSAVKSVDGSSLKLTEHPAGRHAWALTLNDATGAVYVTRIEDAEVAFVSAQPAQATAFAAGAIPCSIAINPKQNILYVANSGDNTVTAINGDSSSTIATIAVGERPESVAYDAARDLVYVANTLGGTVSVIDATSNVVVATLAAGKSPFSLAVVPGSDHLYVANASDEKSSSVVDVSKVRRKGQ
jgi:YVTN family beta-propeller protein